MLITNVHEIGERLLLIRKKAGLTQSETAEREGLSDRTYADIERGAANMRLETLLKICRVFHITPNDLLTTENDGFDEAEALRLLNDCPSAARKTALELLCVYLRSLK